MRDASGARAARARAASCAHVRPTGAGIDATSPRTDQRCDQRSFGSSATRGGGDSPGAHARGPASVGDLASPAAGASMGGPASTGAMGGGVDGDAATVTGRRAAQAVSVRSSAERDRTIIAGCECTRAGRRDARPDSARAAAARDAGAAGF
jgi:hypothetical protein